MVSASPLAGVTVVELGHNVAMPFGGQVLADLGAEVIKVESPTGDAARAWPPFDEEGESAVFQALNRGKLGVTVDLEDEDERRGLVDLILGRADVVVQNLRHGVVERFGLDATTLLSRKPSLVYCNLAAYGAEGPMADRPGYDPLVQGFSGIMRVTGEPGRPPVRCGVSVNDVGSGLWSVIGILAALRDRDRTGQGGRVDLSLFETALNWMGIHAACYEVSGIVEPPQGSGAPFAVPYQAFRTRDGWIMVAAANDRLWGRFCEAVGHTDWRDDPHFRTNAGRVANRHELVPLIEAVMKAAPTATWAERFDAAGVPSAPIQDIGEVMAHPQTEALDIVRRARDGGIRTVGPALSFDGERPHPLRRAPRLGQHVGDVFPRRREGR